MLEYRDMSARRRHRHLFVLPCCIVAALLPAVVQRSQWHAPVGAVAAAQSWVGDDAQAPVPLRDGSWAFLTPGTRLALHGATYVMEDGSMTLRARDAIRTVTKGWTVLAWRGDVQVTTGTRITVAAIGAPVVLAKDGRRFLLPAGMSVSLPLSVQLPGPEAGWCAWMTSLAPEPLPEFFLLEQARLLRTLPQEAPLPPATLDTATFADDDVDAWLLQSLHPDGAGVAWLADAPASVTADDMLQRMALLPFADRAARPLSPLAAARLVAALQESVVQYGEGERLAFIIDRLTAGAELLKALGFPERAARYRDAAATMRADAERFQVLPTVSCGIADAGESVAQPALQASLLTVETPSEPPLAADAVRQRLAELGGLLTRDSVLRPLADGSLEVHPVLFARADGYRAFHLVLDGQARTALVISEGTQTYPNAMPLERFAAWAKGE